MQAPTPLSDYDLKQDVGIAKIGHRQRILTRLTIDAAKAKPHKIECDSCTLL
jgi:hypothetical protein